MNESFVKLKNDKKKYTTNKLMNLFWKHEKESHSNCWFWSIEQRWNYAYFVSSYIFFLWTEFANGEFEEDTIKLFDHHNRIFFMWFFDFSLVICKCEICTRNIKNGVLAILQWQIKRIIHNIPLSWVIAPDIQTKKAWNDFAIQKKCDCNSIRVVDNINLILPHSNDSCEQFRPSSMKPISNWRFEIPFKPMQLCQLKSTEKCWKRNKRFRANKSTWNQWKWFSFP